MVGGVNKGNLQLQKTVLLIIVITEIYVRSKDFTQRELIPEINSIKLNSTKNKKK